MSNIKAASNINSLTHGPLRFPAHSRRNLSGPRLSNWMTTRPDTNGSVTAGPIAEFPVKC
jgi:hypothetical protein